MNWLESEIGKELKLNESLEIKINYKTFIDNKIKELKGAK